MSAFDPEQAQEEAHPVAPTEDHDLRRDKVRSSSRRYAPAHDPTCHDTPLALAACSTGKVLLPPPQADARPIVAEDELQGRWTITSVNERQSNGLWLELGGEGLATITTTKTAVFMASPQPPTLAYLGCNDWYPSGWTRNGDKLTLGREMSHRTERGCDAATMALEDEAYAIVSKSMTMELTPPNRLRLVNESGTIELVR